jgi:hypothetical protein
MARNGVTRACSLAAVAIARLNDAERAHVTTVFTTAALRRAGVVDGTSKPPACRHTGNNVPFALDGGKAKFNHLSEDRVENAENHVLLTVRGAFLSAGCANNVEPLHFCLQNLTKARPCP